MIKILGHPKAFELSQIMLSVGLSQNFAALRALSIEGIQRGHMNLHARNVAMGAGIPNKLIPEAVLYMREQNSITEKSALTFLKLQQLKIKGIEAC